MSHYVGRDREQRTEAEREQRHRLRTETQTQTEFGARPCMEGTYLSHELHALVKARVRGQPARRLRSRGPSL